MIKKNANKLEWFQDFKIQREYVFKICISFSFSDVWVIHAGMYQIREANQMVEEFMLAANVSVAKKIYDCFPSCSLLR